MASRASTLGATFPATWRRPLLLVLRVGAIAAGAAALLTFVLPALRGTFSGQLDDLGELLSGARLAAAGANPYGPALAAANELTHGLPFVYPPFVAVLLRPFAVTAQAPAQAVWVLLLLASSVTGCVVTARTFLPATWPRVPIAILTATLFVPATYNLWHGNINSVVFLLLALAARDWAGGREVRCGGLIGLAAAIKLGPVVLLALFVRRRWWRGLIAAAATVLATVVAGVVALGFETTRVFVTQVFPLMSRDDGWILDQTWSAVANRLLMRRVLVLDPAVPLLHPLMVGLGVVAVAAVAWQVRPGLIRREVRGAEFGAGVAVMLLAAPFAWYEQWVQLIIPVAACAGLLAAGVVRPGRLGAALITLVMVVTVVAPPLLTGTSFAGLVERSHSAGWWPWLQLTSLPALALTWFLGELVLLLRRGEDPVPARTG
ncbi:MAG TPA: glycosyltransferase family 87 protein [Candidatus Dormibacteraeota bacterium]